MKKFIFWKLVKGRKKTVHVVIGRFTKSELKEAYKNNDFDGIDSVNI